MRRSGRSYKEIQRKLKVPLATLSDWFSDRSWSKRIRERLTNEAQKVSTVRLIELDRIRGEHLVRVYEEARSEARSEFKTLQYHPLFIAGLMLYWGEGDKRTHDHVRLTNTDPEMIKLFVFFLLKICNVPKTKIRAGVLIYPDLHDTACQMYWSGVSGLPLSHFHKCTEIVGRHKTNRLSYGVCNIIVSSTYLKAKMLEWLRLLPKELMSKGYYANI